MKVNEEIDKAMIKLQEARLLLSQARDHCDSVYDPDRAAAGVHYNDVTSVMQTIDTYLRLLEIHRREAGQ